MGLSSNLENKNLQTNIERISWNVWKLRLRICSFSEPTLKYNKKQTQTISQNTEDDTSGKLNWRKIADLPFLITLLAISQKSR